MKLQLKVSNSPDITFMNDGINSYTFDTDNIDLDKYYAYGECNPQNLMILKCGKIPAQFNYDHPTEKTRREYVKNNIPSKVFNDKTYNLSFEEKQYYKSRKEKKPDKELVKCQNYDNCNYYRGLNYTADALYKRIHVRNNKVFDNFKDKNIFTVIKHPNDSKTDSLSLKIPHITTNPDNKIYKDSDKFYLTYFKKETSAPVNFKNESSTLNYDFENVIFNIFTPYIINFSPNNITNLNKLKIETSFKFSNKNNINYTNVIKLDTPINPNIKVGMIIASQDSNNKYSYNINNPIFHGSKSDFPKDNRPNIKIEIPKTSENKDGFYPISYETFYNNFTAITSIDVSNTITLGTFEVLIDRTK